MNLGHVIHRARQGLTKNRIGRLLHSNLGNKLLYPRARNAKVLRCLCDRYWAGPVWDVGAFIGQNARRVSRSQKVFAFESNLNVVEFLGYNVRSCENVVVVPCALTVDGKPMKASSGANSSKRATGPIVATISVTEAFVKFGRPGVINLDIEGGEYELLKCPLLWDIPLVVEWHREIPSELPHWSVEHLDETHSLLMPRKS